MLFRSTSFVGNLTGTASTATSAATAYALASTGTTYVNRATLADTVNTQIATANADHYLTFVDANNASATTETVYTTSTFTINPGTGAVSVGGDMYVGGSVVAGNLLDSGKALALAMGMAMP